MKIGRNIRKLKTKYYVYYLLTTYLERFRLLFQLHSVFLSQFPLRPPHVLLLICQLGVVLTPDLFLPQRVHSLLLPVLQLLGLLVMSEEHRVRLFQLLVTFTQFLHKKKLRLLIHIEKLNIFLLFRI